MSGEVMVLVSEEPGCPPAGQTLPDGSGQLAGTVKTVLKTSVTFVVVFVSFFSV